MLLSGYLHGGNYHSNRLKYPTCKVFPIRERENFVDNRKILPGSEVKGSRALPIKIQRTTREPDEVLYALITIPGWK